MNKNLKHWYWEMEETDENGSLPRTAVLEELPAKPSNKVPCPASADWFAGENTTATHQRFTPPRRKLQVVVWGPEHAFVVEIAHRPASPQSATTKEG